MGKFKRLFIILLIFSFPLISNSNAGWNPYILKTTFGQVADSTGSTYNYGDYTATNAFFWSSLDLSPYAGTDLGSTPYYIELLDTAGKKATGYLAGPGADKQQDDFARSNRTLNGDTSPSGNVWNLTGAGYLTASIISGRYVAITNTYAYLLFDAIKTIRKIEGSFSFVSGGGADNPGDVLCMIADNAWSPPLENMLHLHFGPTGWDLQKRLVVGILYLLQAVHGR